MSNNDEFSGYSPTWCPGCGDWGIGASIKTALTQLEYDPSTAMVVFGIGCSGNMNDFLNAYALHSLHGRALPNAIGMKMANHKMPVIVIAGDGDTYGEGGNHFLHACRGNHDITIIVHDNGVYGLTTGQVAPTGQTGFKSRSTPSGIIEVPVNPLTLAISQGATYVAQAYAGNIKNIVDLIKQGITHKGFSLINVLQPCVTFNHVNTYSYYKDRVYFLPDKYDPSNMQEALKKGLEPTTIEKFPLGILYDINRPCYTDSLPQLKNDSLVEKKRFTEYDDLLKEFE